MTEFHLTDHSLLFLVQMRAMTKNLLGQKHPSITYVCASKPKCSSINGTGNKPGILSFRENVL